MNLRNSIFILIILLIIFLSMGFVTSVDIDDNSTSLTNNVQVDEVETSSIGTQNLDQTDSNDVYDDKLTLEDNDVLSADDNQIIYVGPSSAGTADGSRDHPYTSISTALSHTLSGKTNEIVVLNGTYRYTSAFTISKDNLIIRADDDANPVISFAGQYSSYNRWTISGNNVTIKGIEFTNNLATSGYSTGMLEITGTNIAVSDCEFTAVRGTRPIYANRATNLLIENSSFIGLDGNNNEALGIYNSNNVTIRNNHVEGFGSSSRDGSGVYASSSNIIIDNNTFTNMRSDNGIIYKSGSTGNVYIQNNRFLNSTSSSSGGAIYSFNDNVHILNNTFTDISAQTNGGAIYLTGKNHTISGNSFNNCSATQNGGAIYMPYSSTTVNGFDNNSFYNCSSTVGGALYSAPNLEINNAYFEDCSAVNGSAAYLSPEYTGTTYTTTINNSTFVNNNATSSGTVYSAFPNFAVSNSTFENNTAGKDGGALYIEGKTRYSTSNNAITSITNTTFNNNSAVNGGAIYTYKMYDSILDNDTFTNNTAVIGGAVFIDYPRGKQDKSQNNAITNSNFENNSAEMGGAVVIYSSDSTVSNSTFTNNNATRYGGGAVIMGGKNSQIINNTFANNTAFLYGGAIGTNDSYIGNNSFINNSAYQAGAILTINSTIAYNNFTDNNATRGPDVVYIDTYEYYTYDVICNCTNCTDCSCTIDNCNCTNASMIVVATNLLINNTLDEDSVYCYNDTQILRVVKNANGMYYLYQDPSIITDRYFYKAYCIEMDASIPIGYNGTDGILVEDLTFVRNSLDQSYVGDYIKVLIILYEKVQYNLKDYIYVFTDGDYMNSEDPIIQNVINITHDSLTILDNGFNIVNDTYSCYWFQSFINPTTRQNLILINGCKPIEFPDLVPTKTADVSKVSNGDNIAYTVKVYNDHNITLTNVTVTDNLGSGDWYISSWTNTYNDAWVRLSDNKWQLNRPLRPGESAQFEVICHVNTANGNPLTNTIDVFAHETEHHYVSETVDTERPLILDKYATKKLVARGELVDFKIVVTNNGKETMNNIRVDDVFSNTDFEWVSLTSDVGSWSSSGWSTSGSTITRGVYLSGGIAPGQSAIFTVTLRALKDSTSYTMYNNARLYQNSNYIMEDSDSVSIYTPYISLDKQVSQSVYNVGDTVKFTIYVRNPTSMPLTGVYVEDFLPDGLQFTNWEQQNSWSTYSTSGSSWTMSSYDYQQNLLRFNLMGALEPNLQTRAIYIYCKATQPGHAINNATAYADGANPYTDRAEYTVLEPSIAVQKTTIDRQVYVGENVSFTIKVTNDGNRALTNVVVHESLHKDLTYLSYTDGSKKWIKNSDLSWTYNGTLAVGQSSQFEVTFRADKTGTLTNVVHVSTKEGPSDDDSDDTTVIIRPLTGTKLTVDKVVSVGDNVTFIINVENTRNQPFNNVFVKETDIEGLTFLSWKQDGTDWTYNETSKIFKYGKTLNPGEVASFNVTFRADKMGNWTNVIIYGADGIKNFTAENDTFVKAFNMSVQKIAIDKVVFLGDEIRFLIVVNNTGNERLTNVYVNETDFGNLTFLRYEAVSGMWRLVQNNGYIFRLAGGLNPNASASFLVVFNATETGNYTNVVVGNSDQVKNVSANNTTSVEIFKLKIEKITIDKVVNIGENVTFTIRVTNIGDSALDDVFVTETSHDGLKYLSFVSDKGNWEYTDGKFKLLDILDVDDTASFNITFKTTKTGNLTNVIVGTYDGFKNVTTNNTTSVYNANMTVQKITIDTEVMKGDNVTFTIIVKNTGETNLTGVYVNELEYDGLTYSSYASNVGTWTKEGDSYKLDGILKVGESASFNITFIATSMGNVTNVVVAGSNETKETKTNNTTYIRNPDFEVVKDTLNATVGLNDEVTFTIVVTNTGNVNLTKVTVYEDYPAGLKFVGSSAGWATTDNKTFVYDGILEVGKEIQLNITFKAIALGNLTNVVNVSSPDVPENKTTNKTVTVPNPDFEVVKDALNATVRLNDEVTFTIVVTNTGDVNLTKVTVYEDYPAGLKFVGSSAGWATTDNKTFVYDGILEVGKEIQLNITFKAIALGNLINVVNVNTHEVPENSSASDDVLVICPNMTVEKITNNVTVFKGEQVSFTVIVKNTGDTDLSDVFVEDKNYTAGLVYSGYVNMTGSGWKHSNGKFVYDGILKVGESASFDVIFDTTKTGKFNNTVVAGSSSTDNVTSTNTTKVIDDATEDDDNPGNSSSSDDDDLPDEDDSHGNSTVPGDDGVPEDEESVPEDDTSNPEDESDESEADDEDNNPTEEVSGNLSEDESFQNKSNVENNMRATGNPIFALLLVLLTMAGVARRYRK